ncbi:hypothetical protein ES708_30297 [subsurface metagenome]
MATLKAMPAESVIGKLRGVLDFYYWCDLVIVRSWPRPPSRPRAGDVASAEAQFGYIAKQTPVLTPTDLTAYQDMVEDSAFSWRDFMTRLYVNGYKSDFMVPD